jgi:hypothetical protein
VLYGAIAQRTSKMRIGHGVRLLPFPYNHPVRAAEQAAVLDLLCDRRLDFGTGPETLLALNLEPPASLTFGQWRKNLSSISN